MAHLFVWLCLKACSSNLEDEFLHFVTICVCEFVWRVWKNMNIFNVYSMERFGTLALWLCLLVFFLLWKRCLIIELRRGFSTLRLPGLRLGDWGIEGGGIVHMCKRLLPNAKYCKNTTHTWWQATCAFAPQVNTCSILGSWHIMSAL